MYIERGKVLVLTSKVILYGYDDKPTYNIGPSNYKTLQRYSLLVYEIDRRRLACKEGLWELTIGLLHLSVQRAYTKWYCPPAVGHIALSSPRLAATQKQHSTQKINPYKSATELPEGRTRPIEPASAIQVLCRSLAISTSIISVHTDDDRDILENGKGHSHGRQG